MAYASTITDILNVWADLGIFAYVLPFLMIFAVVFGILNKTNVLGSNKGVQATIALAVGLLSLQFDYVANFFATIFPYTGMGIAILLIALILMGLFSNDSDFKWVKFLWVAIGIVIFLVVVFSSLSDFSWWGGGYGWFQSWPAILIGLAVVGLLIWVVMASGKESKKDN